MNKLDTQIIKQTPVNKIKIYKCKQNFKVKILIKMETNEYKPTYKYRIISINHDKGYSFIRKQK